MSIVFEGAISVKAALQSPYREIDEIWMDEKKKSKDFGYILKMSEIGNIPVKRVSKDMIETVAKGHTHGGVIAFVKERTYVTLEELLAVKRPCFLALLEGIEDPYNVGYALRSLYASGCQGMIMPKRNWANEEGAIVKSSAGASEKMPWYVCENYDELVEKLEQEKIHLVCAMREDAWEMYDYDYTQDVVIALGGPLRGLSSQLLKHSAQNIYIPYANDFRNALNASSAVSILAYEVYRQRRGMHE